MAKEQRAFAQLPLPKSGSNGKQYDNEYVQFRGYNALPVIERGELVDMTNMRSDLFPIATNRNPRSNYASVSTPNGILASKQLAWVDGTTFKYNNDTETVNNSSKCMVNMGDYILVFPDKKQYDTTSNTMSTMQGELDLISGKYNTSTGIYEVDNNQLCTMYSIELNNGTSYTISKTGSNGVNNGTYVLYDASYKYVTSGSFTIGSAITTTSSHKYMHIVLNTTDIIAKYYISNTVYPSMGKIPDMDFVVVYNNRLCGVSKTDNKSIYVSCLGRFDKFTLLNITLASSLGHSYTATVGTDGYWIGITVYQNHVIFFKKDVMHKMFGDRPENYQIQKAWDVGCIDNNSICEVNGVLYFLGRKGIYAYTGGQPQLISNKLNKEFVSGSAGTDGRKYYISAYDGSTYSLYVYDTMQGAWHIEDNLRVYQFARYNGLLYAQCSDSIKIFNSGTETINWSITTEKITGKIPNKKLTCDLYIRLDLEEGSYADIYTTTDNEDFVLQKTIDYVDFSTIRVPLRIKRADSFQVKIEGRGNVKIYELHIKYALSSEV